MSTYPFPFSGYGDAQPGAAAAYPLPGGGVWTVESANTTTALTGTQAAVHLGSVTTTLSLPLTGFQIGVQARNGLSPSSGAALSGLQVATKAGSLGAGSELSLSGIQVGVQLGNTGAGDASATLGGVQAGVQVGDLAPSVEIALTGIRAGVQIGRLRVPATDYDLAWTRRAYRSQTIPSYLYVQYNDDDDLQAFVAAYNELAQEVISWFVNINLPIYTGPLIIRELLDWVAEGLYGIKRPTLPSGLNRDLGPLNTYMMNVLPPNGRRTISPSEVFATTDEIFKRIITWNFYKGDGRTFNVRWLKRRVMRFLTGVNGTDPGIADTYPISVTFGANHEVTIHILPGIRTVTGGAIPNVPTLNSVRPNQLDTSFTEFDTFEYAQAFKAAVDAGALQLPFQYTWNVVIT